MRVAKAFGGVRELFPPGITDLREMPYPWFQAIRHALVVVGWDELEPEFRPKKSIWMDGDALKAHFEWVEAVKKERFSGNPETAIEDPVENQAVKDLVVG